MLQYVMMQCSNYAELIAREIAKRPGHIFELILYTDEAQGGNLLQPDSSKKASLWYFALKEVGWTWTDIVWHPLSLVQHKDLSKACGGFSGITKAIFDEIGKQELHIGFPLKLPGGSTLLKCDAKYVISDLDSIRGALSLKGSSAIRPCVFCRNCVKKHCGVNEFSDEFQDITSSNVDGFKDQTDQDIFEAWDYLLQQKRILSKATFQKKEIAFGFNIDENSLLACRRLREIVPPSHWVIDIMHCYWSNGVCSWESNELFHLWQQTGIGNLQQFMSLDWKTSAGSSNTSYWRTSLCHESNFAGGSYRGSASNLQCFF